MQTKKIAIISGLIGFGLLATFVVGLAISISQGFAGFYGGLPFSIIVGFVLILALYDLYDTTIRKSKKTDNSSAEDQ